VKFGRDASIAIAALVALVDVANACFYIRILIVPLMCLSLIVKRTAG
jgi:hypothetical protein